MDVDDVLAARGSRPDRLLDVSGPQERVQRRTVQQIVDYPSLPFLDDPAPQMVGQVIEVPKIPRSSRWSYRRFVDSLRQPQTAAEQLVEVPTILSHASLLFLQVMQRTVEQNVDISAVGDSGAGGGLSGFLPGQSYSFTAEQIVDNPVPRPGVLEVFKVFSVDRVQQRFRSRSLSFPIQVAADMIFSLSRAPQRHFSPEEKKCEDPAHPGVGTGCALELMDAVSLAGVSSVAQHGVRLLLLVAEKQEWCLLVCSSGSPSYPVAWSSCWCRLCLATSPSWRLLEEFPLLVLLAALFAPGNLDFAFALVSFSPSVFGCCLWSTLYSGSVLCLVQQWIHVLREAFGELHIFSTCGALRPVAFLSIPQNGEVCTVDASSCSVSSRGSHFESGHYFYELSM